MVFVTQCPEVILLRHFTPVCLLLIKILLDGSKINLIENTELQKIRAWKSHHVVQTQLCRLVTICMKPSPSFLRSPGDSLLVKIKPANLPRLDISGSLAVHS